MRVESIAECSKGSILQYFCPSLATNCYLKTFVVSIFGWQFLHRFYCIKASDEMTNSVGTVSHRTLLHIALQTYIKNMCSFIGRLLHKERVCPWPCV